MFTRAAAAAAVIGVATGAGAASGRRFLGSVPAKPRYGFIGLGQMGYPMATNLLSKTSTTNPFHVYDTSAPTLAKFKAANPNAVIAPSPRAVAENSDIMVTMLPAGQHVRAVYDDMAEILKSRTPRSMLLIDSSTIDIPTTRHIAAIADQYILDAPVSGGTLGAEAGTLTFMVGADKDGELFQLVKDSVCGYMGKNVVGCGAVGNGQVAKVCNNLMLGISMIAAAETLNLGAKLGMDPKLLSSIMNTSTARSWSTDTYNPAPGVLQNVPSSRDYSGGFGTKLMAKDLALAVDAASSVGAGVVLGAVAGQIYRVVDASGKDFEGRDFSVVYKWLHSQGAKK